jgi:hypothetical protein
MAKVADKLHNNGWAGYCFVRLLFGAGVDAGGRAA